MNSKTSRKTNVQLANELMGKFPAVDSDKDGYINFLSHSASLYGRDKEAFKSVAGMVYDCLYK